jgi:hypothetical protein
LLEHAQYDPTDPVLGDLAIDDAVDSAVNVAGPVRMAVLAADKVRSIELADRSVTDWFACA